MKILESGENYLETILLLSKELELVRSVDVAAKLGYSKPSVSRAMGILRSAGYIIIEDTGNISLTESGMERASGVYERHVVITRFLRERLGLSADIAELDACRIEHIISDETFDAIKREAGDR